MYLPFFLKRLNPTHLTSAVIQNDMEHWREFIADTLARIKNVKKY